ncbi:hypothetical protein GCM10010121_062700 [Streptomyces brasiliensis]|uniref:Uncharacterized protein n=1 Tax=Streptomyces brasiliensis TaxID=1954 RepID=A0A917L3H7_9ACTN|nr:hypothetical protein GCM10010121_062700 [Streptomyces brasiliensis]
MAETFATAGLGRADAHSAADALVAADAQGSPSRGVARLPVYLTRLRGGGNSPDALPQIVQQMLDRRTRSADSKQ